jgi:chromosome segregation ATPase
LRILSRSSSGPMTGRESCDDDQMLEEPVDGEPVRLSEAYERRSEQLYEARGALAEAVSAVCVELERARREREQSLAETSALRAQIVAFENEIEKLRRYVEQVENEARHAHAAAARLDEQLASVRGMKVVRWTTWLRAAVAWLRARAS